MRAEELLGSLRVWFLYDVFAKNDLSQRWPLKLIYFI